MTSASLNNLTLLVITIGENPAPTGIQNQLQALITAHRGFIFKMGEKEVQAAFLTSSSAFATVEELQQISQSQEWKSNNLTLSVKVAFELGNNQDLTVSPLLAREAGINLDLETPADRSEDWLLNALVHNVQKQRRSQDRLDIELRTLLSGQDAECQGYLENNLRQAAEDRNYYKYRILLIFLALLRQKNNQPGPARLLAEEALASSRQAQERGSELIALAVLANLIPEEAPVLRQKTQELQQNLELNRRQAVLLGSLGKAANLQGDLEAARTFFKESYRLNQLGGDRWEEAVALANLADTTFAERDYETASDLSKESLALVQQMDEAPATPALLCGIGYLLAGRGDYAAARWLLEESRKLSRKLAHSSVLSSALFGLGGLALAQNDLALALRYYKESLVWAWRTLDPFILANSHWGLGEVALRQEDLARARSFFKKSFSLSLAIANPALQALGLEGMAKLWMVQGQTRRAARLFGAANRLREEAGVKIPPLLEADYEAKLALARARLGERLFKEALNRGKSQPPEIVFRQGLGTKDQLRPKQDLTSDETAESGPDDTGWPDEQAVLSRRELEVLKLAALGHTNKEIARQLDLSDLTIGSYLRSIYNKLGVGSRTAAVSLAIKKQKIP
jgi:ATP/maltotriose-dependent transcriptional regulator MalT